MPQKEAQRSGAAMEPQMKADNFRVVPFETNELRVLRAAFHVLQLSGQKSKAKRSRKKEKR
jgi:hypothetical protein